MNSDSSNNPVFDDNDFADKYASKHKKMAINLGRKISREIEKRKIKNKRIFDAGCGFGGVVLYLAEHFPDFQFVGIDLSEAMLKIAIDRCKTIKENSNICFEKANVEEIPFCDNTFDIVINTNMLHIVKNPIVMLNEIERVLKPEGFFYLVDLRRSWLGIFEKAVKHSFTVKEAMDILNKSNLREGKFSSNMLWWFYENFTVG